MRIVGNTALFTVEDPEPLLAAMPWAKYLNFKGQHVLGIPHDFLHMQAARGCGLDAPAPIEQYSFPGKFKPFEHQKETMKFLVENMRAYCLNGLGTGKTAATTWAADYLMEQKVIRRCLIVAPLSTLERVWGDHIYTSLPKRKFVVLHGTKQQRLDLLKTDWSFAVVNHHGMGIIGEYLPDDVDLIVFDELAVLRQKQAKTLWGEAKKLMTPRRWGWGLTGSPVPNSPTDAYAQCQLLTPENYKGSFTRFKSDVMTQVNMFKWVPRATAEATVNEILQPSIRYALEDCIDLPETIMHSRDAEMSPEQKLHYDKLKKECMTEVRGVQITAVNAAVLCGKLIQASCIAEDTMVCCLRGWVPIQKILPADLVWDGVEWTEHHGLLDKGCQHVINCNGANITPEHEVLTSLGWKPAQEAVDGESAKRFTWASVRLPDSYSQGRVEGNSRDFSVRLVEMQVRLWSRSSQEEPELEGEESIERQALRMPYRDMADPRNEQDKAIQYLESVNRKMPIGYKQRLEALRRTWDNCMQAMGKLVRGLLVRYARRLYQGLIYRSDRQQWPLQPRELSVEHPYAAGKQQAIQCQYRYPKGADDSIRSREGIRLKSYYSPCEDIPVQMADSKSTTNTRELRKQVYDLKDCGIRNRFVIKGANGELSIVHNCGLLYNNGETLELDFGPRLAVLEECMEEVTGKIIIFAPLTGVIHALYNKLKKKYDCVIVEGATSAGKRNQIFNDFNFKDAPQVIIAAPQCMSHGLNLHHRCSTIIWFTGCASNEVFTQANARTVRPGQTQHTNIFMIAASPVERKIYQTLKDRGSFQAIVLEMAKEK